MSQLRIGISGWTYEPWRGVFYPPKLPQHSELPFAASKLTSIEINGTFYSLQKPDSFAKWADLVPDDFVFSVKAPRYITHILRLANSATPVANFFASGLLRLGPKLGPILWQLPPNYRLDPAALEAFLKLLPHDTEAAVACAHCHDKKVANRSWLKTDAQRPVRHAIEIRNKSFVAPQFVELLRQYNVALVCADTVEWPRLMDVTSDFMYCRLHGAEVLYASGYDDAALDVWAARVRAWSEGGEPAHADRILPATFPILGGDDDLEAAATSDRVTAAKHAAAHEKAQEKARDKKSDKASASRVKSARRGAKLESAASESGASASAHESSLHEEGNRSHAASARIADDHDAAAIKGSDRAGRDQHTASRDAATAGSSNPSSEKLVPRDVFIYFDNDTKVRAPFDAQYLMSRLGVAPTVVFTYSAVDKSDAASAPVRKRSTKKSVSK
jgi:uncharacterized protein YecE (DUF72 family)